MKSDSTRSSAPKRQRTLVLLVPAPGKLRLKGNTRLWTTGKGKKKPLFISPAS